MVRPAVKARTPTSAPGNRVTRSRRAACPPWPAGAQPAPAAPPGRRGRGFTLIELLLVLTLVGLTAALVSVALRDSAASRLDEEAARLAALLESARADARALGLAVRFELGDAATGAGFRFVGLPPKLALPQHWLHREVQAEIADARFLRLGPEPMIGAQRITLRLGERELVLATDGLAPFGPMTGPAVSGAAGGPTPSRPATGPAP